MYQPLSWYPKLNYKKEDNDYKIVSVQPSSIVGASQLWVFNTNSRQLGVYNALDRGGFTVSGSSIKNYDEKTSVMKRLRKPEDILPKVLKGGKIVLRKLLPSIKSKESSLTGRINKHVIILKVVP